MDPLSSEESPWGDQETQFFYQLTPDRILDAVEKVLDIRCTGRAFAHNSMENRVYELELDLVDAPKHPYERFRIAKFYRPGRWSLEQIQEEHKFLLSLQSEEIPAVAPLKMNDGQTVAKHSDTGLYYCVFPKVGGRSPYELGDDQLAQVGRLLARLHNIGATQKARHRISLTADTYARNNLNSLLRGKQVPVHLESAYTDIVLEIASYTENLLNSSESIQIHGDCHLGNLLWSDEGPFWVDFDDSVIGPPIQDLWLMVLGRGPEHKEQLNKLIRAYEMMREFDWDSLALIEPLRALRMIHFHAWIAKRYKDPSFQRAFPDFGTDQYWQNQVRDLNEQRSYFGKAGLW